MKAFVWKFAKNRILSLQNMARRNVPIQSPLCSGCAKDGESAGHLFFRWELFSRVWTEILKSWDLAAPLHDECTIYFLQFSGLFPGNVDQMQCWELIWFVAIWVIWSSRNGMMFKGVKADIGEMVEHVKLKSWLWITAKSLQFKYPISNW